MSHRPAHSTRRSAWTAAVAMAVTVWAVSSQLMPGTVGAAPAADRKITICHVPPGNPENARSIEVDANGWNGHDNHDPGADHDRCPHDDGQSPRRRP